jgi:hypothetical protein
MAGGGEERKGNAEGRGASQGGFRIGAVTPLITFKHPATHAGEGFVVPYKMAYSTSPSYEV